MYIKKMYKYKKDGITYISETLPTGAILIEDMDILNAEDGNDLIRIADDENVGSSIWLRNGDVQENYREEKHEEPPMEA